MSTAAGPDRRAIGRVARPHGVHGEVVVEVRTDEPERRFVPGSVLDAERSDGTRFTLTVTAVRGHSGRLLVVFAAVADRDAADALRGTVLTVTPDGTGPDDPEAFYDHQLEGLAVELADGSLVGTVAEVLHGVGGELLVVRRTGGPDALVPFVYAIVPTVDLAAARLVITPPEGLLDA